MNQSARPPREFTGRHMLMIMVAFFGVIIAVNFTMAWLAGNSWTGLVVKNSYVASQQFNDKIKDAEAQRKRGWQTKLTYEGGAIHFRLADRNNQPVDLQDAVISIGRPATEIHDRRLELKRVAPGRYVVKDKLGEGIWALVITGSRANEKFRYERRLEVGAS